jgi:hypothetical protein
VELQTAAIAAVVALVTAVLGTSVTWNLERRRWLTGLKVNLQVEVQKTRLLSYPAVFKIFGKMSNRAVEPLDSMSALRVAGELNDWIYSAGGMSADESTRGAVLALRELLLKWNIEDVMPADFYTWRNRALLLLRRDIDISGLESYDSSDIGSLLEQVKVDADKVMKQAYRRRSV